ncbi:Hypothetical_protein [Hexamita inflata]|uniref:Hypothetical_protein n=1 Tax=Hexamita inflata TaxID=28002 RepID=A0AA86U2L7_9EUKA|nr:Hypothetical protein HINF_LOCUS25739 [Hexamita inflata]
MGCGIQQNDIQNNQLNNKQLIKGPNLQLKQETNNKIQVPYTIRKVKDNLTVCKQNVLEYSARKVKTVELFNQDVKSLLRISTQNWSQIRLPVTILEESDTCQSSSNMFITNYQNGIQHSPSIFLNISSNLIGMKEQQSLELSESKSFQQRQSQQLFANKFQIIEESSEAIPNQITQLDEQITI